MSSFLHRKLVSKRVIMRGLVTSNYLFLSTKFHCFIFSYGYRLGVMIKSCWLRPSRTPIRSNIMKIFKKRWQKTLKNITFCDLQWSSVIGIALTSEGSLFYCYQLLSFILLLFHSSTVIMNVSLGRWLKFESRSQVAAKCSIFIKNQMSEHRIAFFESQWSRVTFYPSPSRI